MAYTSEYQGVRREVKRNTTGLLVFWPKYNGQNVTPLSATPSIGSAAINGQSIEVTLVAESDYAEDRPITVAWTAAAGASGSIAAVYDVVRTPMGSLVSLNQLWEQRPEVHGILTRIGQLLSPPPATALTPEATAGIYAAKARVELQDRLRAAARDADVSRLALILDRDRLVRAETALALAHVYEAVAKDPLRGTDNDSAQAQAQRAEWERAFAAIGPLATDTDQDGATDTDRTDPNPGVIHTRRV